MSVTLGVVVISGWAFDIAALRQLGPATHAAMNPLTALCFVMSGLALIRLADAAQPVTLRVARALAAIVATLGVVRLLAGAVGLPLAVDTFLFPDAMRSTTDGRANLMAPAAAASFTMLGISLLLLGWRTKVGDAIAEALAVLVLLGSVMAIIAHAYRAGWFETIGRFNRMGLHTAFGLAVLAAGVLSTRPQTGLMDLLSSEGPGGALARRMLPAGLLVPPVLGWLVVRGRREAIFEPELGEMLFVLATMMIFAALVSRMAMQLHESYTERIRAESRLRDSEGRFRLLAENGSDLVSLEDPQGHVLYVSPSCERLLGYTPQELKRMRPFSLCHPEDRERVIVHHTTVLRGEPAPAIAYRVQHRLGRYVWFETLTRAILDDNGRVTRLQSSSRDVTERKIYEHELEVARAELQDQHRQLLDANARLETLATLDGLTGLKNRRAFQERLSEELSRALRYGMPLSLLMIDIDHFKEYNDSFGHLRGDDVLRQVARHLLGGLRDSDFPARFGGEEFAVILPDTPGSGALEIAERIRRSIEASEWAERTLTVSLGVASLSNEVHTAEALVEHADRALYRSKELGRNRVTG